LRDKTIQHEKTYTRNVYWFQLALSGTLFGQDRITHQTTPCLVGR
jgi:hypothetical protein